MSSVSEDADDDNVDEWLVCTGTSLGIVVVVYRGKLAERVAEGDKSRMIEDELCVSMELRLGESVEITILVVKDTVDRVVLAKVQVHVSGSGV